MTPDTDYILGRHLGASMRLDAQHFLFCNHYNYTIHPQVIIFEGMKVAEVGTGTGIWLLEVAESLPKTTQLDGYDISAELFPHKSLIPANMSLNIMDAFNDVPEQLRGVYDVVHLRLWCCIVTGNNVQALINHATQLLKPGGYLQWEEADLGNLIVQGPAAQKFYGVAKNLFQILQFDFRWIENLPKTLSSQGWSILDHRGDKFRPALVPLATKTYLYGYTELIDGIARHEMMNSDVVHATRRDFEQILRAIGTGEEFHWSPVSLLARK